jgi:tetratricopeptide (TPR) repeat protein
MKKQFKRIIVLSFLFIAIVNEALCAQVDDPYRKPEVVAEIKYVRDLLFDGKYDKVVPACRKAQEKYPDLLVWHFAAMLAPQARMLELHNWDLTTEYMKEWDKLLALSQKIPTMRKYCAYDYLCLGGGYGVVGLHYARGRDFRKAFQIGVKALNYLNKTLELDPKCYDAYLGYGIYHYYRGVLSTRLKWLPFFANDKELGLKELEMARKGLYARPLVDAALIYLYKDEGKWKEGLEIALRMRKEYPNSLLIPQLIGFFYLNLGELSPALSNFDLVLKGDPQNGPVHLMRGVTLFYMNRLEEAEAECKACLKLGATDEYNAVAYYYLGEIEWNRGNYAKARELWRKSASLDTQYKEPREALKRPNPK